MLINFLAVGAEILLKVSVASECQGESKELISKLFLVSI